MVVVCMSTVMLLTIQYSSCTFRLDWRAKQSLSVGVDRQFGIVTHGCIWFPSVLAIRP